MARVPQQSKSNRDKTLHSTPIIVWCVLFLITLLILLALLVPMVIAWITKNPLILTTWVCAILLVKTLGKICERIVNAHFELNDKDYIIEEIKARRSIGERRKHKDEDKNGTKSIKNKHSVL